jgi:hypothetical protein
MASSRVSKRPMRPLQQRRAAIVEFGLPYPADPAITRHLAAFLRRHAQAARQALGDASGDASDESDARPPANARYAAVQRRRFPRRCARRASAGTRSATGAGAALRVLHNDHPDVAVARGAVAYALVRQGHGRRIGGGSARSYFLVLEDPGPQRRGICLLPRGSEEGHEIPLPERVFSLRLGQPVRFHLASSVADTPLPAGRDQQLSTTTTSFACRRSPPLCRRLAGSSQREVRVQLSTAMTEVGTLEIHCVARGRRRPSLAARIPVAWRGRLAGADIVGSPATAFRRRRAVHRTYFRGQFAAGRQARRCAVCAATSSICSANARTGKCRCCARCSTPCCSARAAAGARPSTNACGSTSPATACAPASAMRSTTGGSSRSAILLPQGIQYVNESQNWSEWWTFWRRAAGGSASTRSGADPERTSGHGCVPKPTRNRSRPGGNQSPAVTTTCCALSPRWRRLPDRT